jgi:hypothetical protein
MAATGLAVDDTRVYLVESDSSIFTMAKSGGSPALLVAGTASCPQLGDEVATIVSDALTIYWVDGCGSIFKAPKENGAAVLLATESPKGAMGFGHRIAIDDTAVYWVDNENVMRVDKNGGPAVSVAPAGGSGGTYVGGIAVDATDIYWCSYGRVWRTRKP